ncbi:MAG TPA: 30S ribosomal protein S16 [Candidatus Pacearchaeota archaeon]|jgi:small subunit ribosomal protein S16|nr:30S ribosomal protein S16 [Candidatus Pacearchaeota archaeon]HQK58710.1 30S ribosomal protein S16 [Candidatus Pacearchaeota archaeon]
MLTIRLLRIGKKNQPSYKVVVTDKQNPPRGGKFIEEVGFFNPKTKEKNFNKDRVLYWLKVGAQTSDTVYNMLVNEKIINAPKRKMIFTKKTPETTPEETKNINSGSETNTDNVPESSVPAADNSNSNIQDNNINEPNQETENSTN